MSVHLMGAGELTQASELCASAMSAWRLFAQTCEKIHNGNRVSKARQERKRTRKIQAQSCTVGTTDAFLCARYVQRHGLVNQSKPWRLRSWKC